MSRPEIERKKEFTTDVDLEASRQGIAAFAGRSLSIKTGIDELREQILQDREAGTYRNPEDIADFYVAEILQLNMRNKNLGGQEVVATRFLSEKNFPNNVEMKVLKPLFEGILQASRKEENAQDGKLFTILAACYLYEIGIEQDCCEAVKLFTQAADLGDDHAQFYLSKCYKEGMGVKRNLKESFKFAKLAADQGHSRGQYDVGYSYLIRRGVDKNDAQAFRFFNLAADQGHAAGQMLAGICYDNGMGVEQNYEQADAMFERVANGGNADIQNSLGVKFYVGDELARSYDKAFRFFQIAADQGDVNAQGNLALCYKEGHGVQRNPEEALRLFEITANKGGKEGQFQMGYYYKYNRVPFFQPELQHASDVDAVGFFKLAAAQNHPKAQFHLGLCYQKGKGVERDAVEAVKFLRRAYDQNPFNNRMKIMLEREIGSIKQQNLVSAAIAGNADIVQHCLEEGANIAREEWRDDNALTYAAQQGHVATTNAIITTVGRMQRNSDAWWFSFHSTKNNGADWQAIRAQLEEPQVQNLLTKETIIELAGVVIDQQKELIDDMIENFNGRHPDAPIDEKDLNRIDQLQELKAKQRQSLLPFEYSPEVVESMSIKAVTSLLNDENKKQYYADLARKIIAISDIPVLTHGVMTLNLDKDIAFNDQELEILSNPDSLEHAFCVLTVKELLEASLNVQYEDTPSLTHSAIKPAVEKLVRDVPSKSPLKARMESVREVLEQQR